MQVREYCQNPGGNKSRGQVVDWPRRHQTASPRGVLPFQYLPPIPGVCSASPNQPFSQRHTSLLVDMSEDLSRCVAVIEHYLQPLKSTSASTSFKPRALTVSAFRPTWSLQTTKWFLSIARFPNTNQTRHWCVACYRTSHMYQPLDWQFPELHRLLQVYRR